MGVAGCERSEAHDDRRAARWRVLRAVERTLHGSIAVRRRRVNAHIATSLLHKGFHQGESQAGSAALAIGGEARLQAVREDVGGHARAVILHAEIDVVAVLGPCVQHDDAADAAPAHGLHGVLHEVVRSLGERGAIQRKQRQIMGDLAIHTDGQCVVPGNDAAKERQDLLAPHRKIDRFGACPLSLMVESTVASRM